MSILVYLFHKTWQDNIINYSFNWQRSSVFHVCQC